MALIQKEKTKVKAARESTSTHFPNETTETPEDSNQGVLNHMAPETLIDPEDDEGGATHFNNEETYSSKSNRLNGGKTTAKAKPTTAAEKTPKHPGEVKLAPETKPTHPAKAKPSKTKAGIGEDAPAAGTDPDGEFGAGGADSGIVEAEGFEAEQDGETGLQDTQHMPNDEDPAAGYLTGEGEAGASGVDLEGANPQSGLEVEGGDEGGEVSEFDDEAGFEPEPEGAPEVVEDEELEIPAGGEDEMPLLDVDGADDEADDVVFANVGNSVKVIKANRIIASMNKKVAARVDAVDVYLGEQFQEVVATEMSKHGVRAGLKKMGFVLATVNVGKAEVLNKRVAAKAQKLTAGVRAQTQEANAALEQCLAIAAVGVNRTGFFKDTRNELRAALEEEFAAAGVRGAERVIRQVFASKGVEYAKAILTIANQLVEKPVEVRNAFANSLDMTGDGEIEDESMFGDSASPDFQSQFAGEEGAGDEGGEEFVEDLVDDTGAPQTVHAALARPAYARREVKANVSVTAAAVLSGKAPLPWA